MCVYTPQAAYWGHWKIWLRKWLLHWIGFGMGCKHYSKQIILLVPLHSHGSFSYSPLSPDSWGFMDAILYKKHSRCQLYTQRPGLQTERGSVLTTCLQCLSWSFEAIRKDISGQIGSCLLYIFMCLFQKTFFSILRFKPKVSCILNKYSVTELHS